MTHISEAGLASAISNAGGLGVFTPFPSRQAETPSFDYLKSEIKSIKSLTDRPFAINFPMPRMGKNILPMVEAAIKEEFSMATTSGGEPALVVPMLKSAGVKVPHVVSTIRQARLAEEQGCDAVKIPIIAGGGIADARGFVAALALGAEGVHMGTRFLATKECVIDEHYKQALIKVKDIDTLMLHRESVPTRYYRNQTTEKVLEMERAGTSKQEVNAFLSSVHP